MIICRLVLRGVIVTSVLVFLGGLTATASSAAQSTTQVRAVHVAAAVPAVDIMLDGQPAFRNLAQRAASAYTPLPAGRHALRVTPAGQPQQPLLEAEVELRPDAQATLAVLGAAPSLRALVLADDNAAPPAGQAKVRFVHGVPDVPIVDVAASGGGVLADGVGFGGGAAYTAVPAGTYTLQLQADDRSTTLATVPDVTITAGTIVTLFATGRAADNSLRAVPITYEVGGVGTAAASPGPTLPVRMPATGAGLSADRGLRDAALPLLALLLLAIAGGALLRRARAQGVGARS